MAFDLFATITDRFIAELEQGVVPWHKPWHSAGAAISHATGKPYSLLNQLLLGKPGEWLSWKMIQDEGGHVQKSQRSRYVVFWKWLEGDKIIMLPDGSETKEQIPYLRYTNVWHISQVDGISPKWDKPLENPAKPDEAAEAIVTDYLARSGVKLIRTRSDQAFYSPVTDTIQVPDISQFKDVAELYSVLYHEMSHSTGHKSRLARITDIANFGSDLYAQEELVAELGAGFLVHHVGLETPASFRNNAAYLRGWLTALHGDKRLIVRAAGQAEKAVRYILGEEAEQNDP